MIIIYRTALLRHIVISSVEDGTSERRLLSSRRARKMEVTKTVTARQRIE